MASIILKPGREKSVRASHPWLFSGAISRVEGDPELGATVAVVSSSGEPLGHGAFSPASQIRVRLWSTDPAVVIEPGFFRERLAAAWSYRERLGIGKQSDAWRLVNAEADGLPGLIIDRYGDVAVCQCLSAGAEYWKATVCEWLMEQPGIESVYERSDTDARSREGLAPSSGLLAGREPASLLSVQEHGTTMLVDVRRGHKTGLYLDQRDNRQRVSQWCAGLRVLNCFCYSGAFALAACRGSAASVINIDTSAEALELGRQQVVANGLSDTRVQFVQADVFHQLRRYRDSRERFDVIVLDPPKFADTRSQLAGACRGYKDINLLAFKLLNPGGSLFTFSCSGAMDAALFQKIVAGAALDAGREARIVAQLGQAPDHPVTLTFPEGFYLKGLHLIA